MNNFINLLMICQFSMVSFRSKYVILKLMMLTIITVIESVDQIIRSYYICLAMRLAKTLNASLTYKRLQAFSELKKFENNFLTTTNLAFIESLYLRWQKDKSSVSPSFAAYFEELEHGADPEAAFTTPPSPGQSIQFMSNQSPFISQQLKLRMLIERYRSIGHQFAKIDPLNLPRIPFVDTVDRSVIETNAFEFTPEELNFKYSLKSSRAPDAEIKRYTVEDMKNFLEKVYCQSVGYEYTHLLDKDEREFITLQLQQNIESLKASEPSKEQRLKAFERICKDQSFIDFLGNKFGNFKRFGIEGLNSATSALQQLAEASAKLGAKNLVLGMAHRGRLNTLHCVFDKPAQSIFKEFLQKTGEQDYGEYSGDVKYHLGQTVLKKFGKHEITLTMLPNPSHLETVNPLVYGSVRAMMEATNDFAGNETVGVLIHGDAAMSGQGIMYESVEMQDLKDYTPRGIIHIVMNNQIGFTTGPTQGRSSLYCTQVAKAIGAPVFHVNANEPGILDMCIRIAAAYRFKFKKDIFIDIVGYRRYGHNEQDQPFFTQPKMYEIIKNMPTVYQLSAKKMIQKGVLTKEEVEAKRNAYLKKYEEDYEKVMSDKSDKYDGHSLFIKKIQPYHEAYKQTGTGVSKQALSEVFEKITTWPADFNIHPTIKKIYEERIKNFNNNEPLDWATMESLAFASLLKDGYGVRLSGQDVERGTFSHRHAFISDQKKDVPKYFFLKKVSPKVCVTNSHLSQYGVMGFEYGYSLMNPNSLTIWEAQFGDFANGAAIMIDNYIVSGQSKWKEQTGLVLNLPHGMDGQGPEHSSARMERFLHMSDDNCDVNQDVKFEEQMRNCNIQVVCCSTTSNYFHAMRRQMIRDYRKPLIMLNSKKLLKFKAANRPISDIIEGTEFVTVYPDQSKAPPSGVKKVLLCNGQFYYELREKRDQLKRNDIAIVRIQQIAPFPIEQLKKVLSVYGKNVQYCWVQEEHENYGPWNFVYPRLKMLLKQPIKFYGRPVSASTANGKLKIHKLQQQTLIKQVFGLK